MQEQWQSTIPAPAAPAASCLGSTGTLESRGLIAAVTVLWEVLRGLAVKGLRTRCSLLLDASASDVVRWILCRSLLLQASCGAVQLEIMPANIDAQLPRCSCPYVQIRYVITVHGYDGP